MMYIINQVFKKAVKPKNCFLGKTNKINQLWVLLERERHTQKGRGGEKEDMTANRKEIKIIKGKSYLQLYGIN